MSQTSEFYTGLTTLQEKFMQLYKERNPDLDPKADDFFYELWDAFRDGYWLGYEVGLQDDPYEGN